MPAEGKKFTSRYPIKRKAAGAKFCPKFHRGERHFFPFSASPLLSFHPPRLRALRDAQKALSTPGVPTHAASLEHQRTGVLSPASLRRRPSRCDGQHTNGSAATIQTESHPWLASPSLLPAISTTPSASARCSTRLTRRETACSRSSRLRRVYRRMISTGCVSLNALFPPRPLL